MSMVVSSCAFLGGRPLPAAMPASPSGGSCIESKKLAAPGVSLSSLELRKPRARSLCFATGPKTDLPAFSISPVVLVNPVSESEERWQVKEEAEAVSLWFEVPGLSKEDLAVEIDEDVLVVKKKATSSRVASGGGGGVLARLLLPGGYSRERVVAELDSGVLRVLIAKVKDHARRRINVGITVK
ncbi:hypothetical protein GUJ93_ZPchr0010g9123 [Zizania palustris]|uniref:SHSP domain-containing protein n=1 Tax=Zizania palustris TaxID=103762 RepID=A0A8J6BNI6_ZIZPA|nr:hypothetical protein GUJ93_ZPchr0010g9123 [Zizania palustris]